MKKVVVIGGGFGGVSVVRNLAKNTQCQITIIDRRNYYLFQPLLYQVAMAGLNPSDISVPLRKLFSKSTNVNVLMAEVTKITLSSSKVFFDQTSFDYDYLVVSTGAKHSYFGNDSWEEFAPGLKTIEQATEIRRRILMAFENAEKEMDSTMRSRFLTFVVVGGGPTGVELAGAIAEMARTTLLRDYHNADLKKTRVLLIEGGDRLLPSFPKILSTKTQRELERKGVEVFLKSRASQIETDGLLVNENKIYSKTILWAAGVTPSKLAQVLPGPKDSSGRIIVNEDLSLNSHKNIFVIGDMAHFRDSEGMPLPGIAPVAVQQGRHVARNIINDIDGRERQKFTYFNKGIMATIGRSYAVTSIGPFQISGFFAWLIWVFVHILYLMQFKNRMFVFFQWVWSYFLFGSGARLIVHKTWKFYSGEKIPIDP
jgi:NADH:ubiquinone reductase (H+-translocating)